MPGSSQKPESDKQPETERFNETLRRMLKTPPKPKEKGDDQSRRPPVSPQGPKDGGKAE